MLRGGLALVVLLLLALDGLPSTDHVVIGVVPLVEHEIRVNGAELPASPVLADSLGILVFTVEVEGPGLVVIVPVVSRDRPSLLCKETAR
jgi:hypothetical protein